MIKTLLVLAATLIVAVSTRAGSISVKGSDTLVILAQKWAEVYMNTHPDVKIEVNGGGSGVGFAALQNQQVDIADASRKIKSGEVIACIKAFGRKPREYKVALDGLSIYVNENNPVKELTLAQLKDIFTGAVKNWKDVGGYDAPITVYSRENSSGTYDFFKEHVLKGEDFTARAQTQQGTAILLQSIARDKHGIGYGGAAYSTGARTLAVKVDPATKGILPTQETVVNGTYPIWRYLYNYVNPELDKDEIHAYLDWIRSPEGQKIVKEVGYYPLPDNIQTNGSSVTDSTPRPYAGPLRQAK
jgi:phosphate transport system substrate-binding protein